MTGKEKCELLRTIRKEIAEKNGIVFFSEQCNNEGNCSGTCAVCDAEIKYLDSELNRLANMGKTIVAAGAVNMIYNDAIMEKSNEESYKYDLMGGMIVEKNDKKTDITIEELDFSVRTYNCLHREGMRTLEDLINYTAGELKAIKNLGKKAFNEIIEKIHELGLELAQ